MFTRRSFASVALAMTTLTASRFSLADTPPTFADRADPDELEADRTLALLFNPVAMGLGAYGGEVDVALGSHLAAAIEADLCHANGITALAVGGGLLVYPVGGAFHRLYVEPRIVVTAPMHDGFVPIEAGATLVGVGATAGWQWTWDYGFSVRLGGGAVRFIGGSAPVPIGGSLDGGRAQLVVDASAGWAF